MWESAFSAVVERHFHPAAELSHECHAPDATVECHRVELLKDD